jgi:hypothetical protein
MCPLIGYETAGGQIEISITAINLDHFTYPPTWTFSLYYLLSL